MNIIKPLNELTVDQRPKLADPFVLRAGDGYYAIGTAFAGMPCDRGVFPAYHSDDLERWEPAGFVELPAAGGEWAHYWAPEIVHSEGLYFLYFSLGTGAERFELRVATSTSPLGPYKMEPKPMLDPATCHFAIDSHPYLHSDGSWYLFYARDFLDTERPGTSLVVSPLVDMVSVGAGAHVVARATSDWQLYEAGRSIYGGTYDWHTLEGPTAIEHGGKLYCFYSGGCWQNETYGVDYVTASHPMAIYSDDNESGSPRVLKTVPGRVAGPGHNSLVQGPDGRTYVVFHAWDSSRSARRLCIDLLEWTEQGPRCTPTLPMETPCA